MANPLIPNPSNPNIVLPISRAYLEAPANQQMIPKNLERPMSRVVIMTGMPVMVSNEETKLLFHRCGNVIEVWQNPVEVFFLEFENEVAACNAVLMTGFTVIIERNGRRYASQLIINYALDEEAKRPVMPFSSGACSLVSEKLSDEDTLSEGTEIMDKWFKNGECNRDNAEAFFNLLKLTTATVEKRSKMEKIALEAETKLVTTVSDIAEYLNVLDQIFNHESFNSILVNFTEDERLNLIQWKKEFEDAKAEINIEQRKKSRNKRNKRSAKKRPAMETISRDELFKLRQEKEDLELQLDVANLALVNDRIEQQNEIDALKKSVLEAQRQCAEYEAQLADWRTIHARLRKPEEPSDSREEEGLSSLEAKILTELSTYLGERLGATLSDIRNHLRRKDYHCTAKSIAQLMRRFPNLFREESVGSGPTIKIKWVFIGCRI